MYQSIDLTKNWSDTTSNGGPGGPLNYNLFGSKVSLFECPSNPSAGQVLDGAPDASPAYQHRVANGDYAGFYGVDPQLFSLGLVDKDSAVTTNGAISKTLKLTFGSFSDGTSNTAHFFESAGRPNIWRAGKLVKQAAIGSADRVNGSGWCRPASELNILRGSSSDGLTFPGPRAINATNGEILGSYPHPYYGVEGTGQIYAFHTGGTNSSFVDGSTRFVNQNIDIRVLARWVSRDGAEVSTEID